MNRKELDQLLAQKKKILKGLDLTKVNMQKPKRVDLSDTVIDTCTLSNLDFTGVSFARAIIKNSWTDGCNFTDCDFSNARVPTIIGEKLRRARFTGVDLVGGELSQCDLRGADFAGVKMSRVDLLASDLRGANFRGATLTRADLSECKVAGADFTGANVDGVDWDKTDVEKAIGLAPAKEAGADDPNYYPTASTEGTPLVAMSADLVPLWTTQDTERAMDAEALVTVAGWVETGRVSVGKAHALVLQGELDTGGIVFQGGAGCVLLRGGSFDGATGAAAAVVKALKKKGWKPFPHTLAIGEGGLWVFDSACAGDRGWEGVQGEFGAFGVPLLPGTYAVDVLGDKDESGPLVFIRLQRK